jgi:membrane-bound lytic murein transglycosylase D
MKKTRPDHTKEQKQNRTPCSVFLFLAVLTILGSAPEHLFAMSGTASKIKIIRNDPDTLPTQYSDKFGFTSLFIQNVFKPGLPYDEQVNPESERFVRDYLHAHRTELVRLKRNAGNYFSFIETMLKSYGLPTELKYLAVIESGLKTQATSWVGAAGPWQFMPETARSLGLVVNENRDDRRDYPASTQAAARFLKKLFNQFQDWLLVIAAYNGGPGVVERAIVRSGSRDFWILQHHLPKESRDHVKKFIATHYIMESAQVQSYYKPNHLIPGINDIESKLELQSVKGAYRANIIAEILGMGQEFFDHYNPAFDRLLAANGCYPLKLPAEKMQAFISRKQEILERSVRQWMNQQ